jgi:hypothetical protein
MSHRTQNSATLSITVLAYANQSQPSKEVQKVELVSRQVQGTSVSSGSCYIPTVSVQQCTHRKLTTQEFHLSLGSIVFIGTSKNLVLLPISKLL